MIPGLHGFVRERQLVRSVDLAGATIGIAAELLADLSDAEIVARLGAGSGARWIVVFDGPARTTPSLLDDGLARRRVMRAVIEAGAPFLVAPALAAAQLAYLYSCHFVSHVAGADEALLFDDAPLVLGVFSSSPVVLQRGALLVLLRLTEPQFVEVALGAGHNAVIEPSYPALDRETSGLEGAIRAAQFAGGGSLLRAARQLYDPAYLAELQRALAFVARQPLLDVDGTLLLSNKTSQPIPKDLADVIGRQLAPETYWYLTKGLVGPELLRGMLWGWFSSSYRVPTSPPEPHARFVALQTALNPVRAQSYALLAARVHRYFQVKTVVNRIDGGANFSRLDPEQPELPDDVDAADPAAVVAAAVRHVLKFVKIPATTPRSTVPEEFATRVIGGEPVPPLLQASALALREFVEAVIVWFLATGKVSREIDTKKLVLEMPWA